MSRVAIIAVTSLPDGLGALELESLATGYGMVKRLRLAWEDGSNRFDGAGEIYLGAFHGGRLIGVGGLSRDPYLDDPRIGRVRHVYVLKNERRGGVGQRLLEQLLAQARLGFDRVRLSTAHAAAFYESLGFVPTDEAGATHRLDFG
jgi:N-acetylglutamate synthase-like GNAT family acetyltransferase